MLDIGGNIIGAAMGPGPIMDKIISAFSVFVGVPIVGRAVGHLAPEEHKMPIPASAGTDGVLRFVTRDGRFRRGS